VKGVAMSHPFNITYLWKKRDKPVWCSEYVDVTPLFLTLERFRAVYEGVFSLRFGDIALHFDFSPDLSTIFEEILAVLKTLAADTELPVELHFYEQGTDLKLLLQRKINAISVDFVKGTETGQLYQSVPEETLSVPADMFLQEWSKFLHAVLEALLEFNPTLQDEESYQEYQASLP
jgi:hypothetical protein